MMRPTEIWIDDSDFLMWTLRRLCEQQTRSLKSNARVQVRKGEVHEGHSAKIERR